MLAYLLLSALFAPTKAAYVKQKGRAEGGGVCGGLRREKSSEGLTRGVSAPSSHGRRWSDTEAWASSCWSQQDGTPTYPASSSCCSSPNGAVAEFFSPEIFSCWWITLRCCCNMWSMKNRGHIFLLAYLFKKRELLSSVLNCILKFEDKIWPNISLSCNSQRCYDCLAREHFYSIWDRYTKTGCLSVSLFLWIILLSVLYTSLKKSPDSNWFIYFKCMFTIKS